jgi:hypothetical protein
VEDKVSEKEEKVLWSAVLLLNALALIAALLYYFVLHKSEPGSFLWMDAGLPVIDIFVAAVQIFTKRERWEEYS